MVAVQRSVMPEISAKVSVIPMRILVPFRMAPILAWVAAIRLLWLLLRRERLFLTWVPEQVSIASWLLQGLDRRAKSSG